MKLLHTGDLHLDSPFSALSVAGAQERREGQRRLLRRIFDCARRERCDLILIAGDLLDSRYVTPETEGLLLQLMRETPCQVILSPGNHDPYVEGSFYQKNTLPENVHLFTEPRLSWFDFPQWSLRVYGYAFCGASLTESPLNKAEPQGSAPGFRVLCAHGDLGDPLSKYAPVLLDDIVKFDIQYAALGHVHCPGAPVTVGNSLIQYCGFPQGRSFDEPGEGGVWIVSMEEGQLPRCERRILSEEQYQTLEIDVSGLHTEEEIRSRLLRETERYAKDRDVRLRILLTGTMAPEISVRDLQSSVEGIGIRNLTVPTLDAEALKKDVTLRGALYRTLSSALISGKAEDRARALRALQIGLAAIDERNIPTEEDLL